MKKKKKLPWWEYYLGVKPKSFIAKIVRASYSTAIFATAAAAITALWNAGGPSATALAQDQIPKLDDHIPSQPPTIKTSVVWSVATGSSVSVPLTGGNFAALMPPPTRYRQVVSFDVGPAITLLLEDSARHPKPPESA